MRACIVGGGLAGSLLAWRLARATHQWRIDLVTGDRRRADATAASGGAVRCYEPGPEQRRLATTSMLELLTSRTLREWSDYTEVGAVSLRRNGSRLAPAIADIEQLVPGSAVLVEPRDLERAGWAELPDGSAAVCERRAGYLSTSRFRDAVMMDGTLRRRVCVLTGEVSQITPNGHGTITCRVAGQHREYDLMVLATGAWTPRMLRANGLRHDGYRTKAIRYAVHPTGDWRPPHFVDQVTGLYGRPTNDGGLLLGVPTENWDIDPDHPAAEPENEAVDLATERFPRLRLGPAKRHVVAADCYATDPVLTLRPVSDSGHQLFTFSGGSGAAAKTALAATHRAAIQLVESLPAAELPAIETVTGPSIGERQP